MKSRAAVAIIIGVLLVLSIGYDFWRGYHEVGGTFGGITYVVLGFVVLGVLALRWIFPQSNSK